MPGLHFEELYHKTRAQHYDVIIVYLFPGLLVHALPMDRRLLKMVALLGTDDLYGLHDLFPRQFMI